MCRDKLFYPNSGFIETIPGKKEKSKINSCLRKLCDCSINE